MKHLYYLRHGESEFNRANRWSGRTDSPLTDNGKRQAWEAGQQAKVQELEFDAILSSPLTRAIETAKIFATELGFPVKDIKQDKVFQERNFGVLEGTRNPLASAKYMKSETGIDKYQGVEKLTELQTRAQQALKVIEKEKADSILVVGHGAFARALWREINNKPLNDRGYFMHNAKLVKLV